jgi:arylsulfatase A-like enzyme
MILAAVLAGCLVSAAEYSIIVFNCGPFWMGPDVFFRTWLCYSAVFLAASLLLEALLRLIKPLNRFFSSNVRRFYLFFTAGWLGASAFLTVLLYRDMETTWGCWTFGFVLFASGILTLVLLKFMLKKRSTPGSRPLILSAGIAIVAIGIYVISDWHFSSVVRARSAQYKGVVPHFCLLVLDTTRGDHLSCYGYPYLTSPNIDKVAEEGLFCTRAFSTANWTPPGHISIFTGLYPSQHGNSGRHYMPDNLLSLSEILKQEGYYCMAMYNNKIAGRNVNITQGFDHDTGVYLNSWVYPAWKRLWDKYKYRDQGAKSTFPMALDAFRWISRKGGHLFIYLNLLEPHWSYEMHEPYFSEFMPPSQLAAVEDLKKVDALCYWRRNIIYDSTKFEHMNAAGYQYLRAAYDSEIAYVDHEFGGFYDGMAEAGLLDEALLVVTADHGEFLGEHHSLGHPAVLFDPVLKIPLMFRYPRLIRPKLLDECTSNVDIFPTVLNLMGYADWIPDDVEGLDILGENLPDDRYILSENLWPTMRIDPEEELVSADSAEACYALRQGSEKLMLNADSLFLEWFPFDTLLFNIDLDPNELNDLHQDQSERTDSLIFELREWISRIEVEPSEEVNVTPEMLEMLKALGYVN